MDNEKELELAKDIIDWLFLNHDHVAGSVIGEFPDEVAEKIEGAFPFPVVNSIALEEYLKGRYPELKGYHYGGHK